MRGCAFEDCGDPACPVCRWARVPQQPEKCGRDLGGGDSCELIAGHPTWVKCRLSTGKSRTENVARDGEPSLAGERERSNLAFRKRSRQGPNYVPHNRRV